LAETLDLFEKYASSYRVVLTKMIETLRGVSEYWALEVPERVDVKELIKARSELGLILTEIDEAHRAKSVELLKKLKASDKAAPIMYQ
jgi:hypothetical protein